MNRLLQGDVGSGKTVVAAGAVWLAAQSGWQSALMAPTEILAAQHYQTLSALFEGTGIRVGLLTGSMKAREKRDIRERLELGTLDLVVGTHALLSAGVDFCQTRAGHHRRAAPLWRHAALCAVRAKGGVPCVGHVRYPDPPDAGSHHLRRSGHLHHERTSARTAGGGHLPDRRGQAGADAGLYPQTSAGGASSLHCLPRRRGEETKRRARQR